MDRAPVRADLRQVGDYARRGGRGASGFRAADPHERIRLPGSAAAPPTLLRSYAGQLPDARHHHTGLRAHPDCGAIGRDIGVGGSSGTGTNVSSAIGGSSSSSTSVSSSDRRPQRMRIRMPRAVRPDRRNPRRPQRFDRPFLDLVREVRETIRGRTALRPADAVARTVGLVQHQAVAGGDAHPRQYRALRTKVVQDDVQRSSELRVLVHAELRSRRLPASVSGAIMTATAL